MSLREAQLTCRLQNRVKVLRSVVGLAEEVLLSDYLREKLVNLVAGMINSSLRLLDGEIEMMGGGEKICFNL